MLANNPASKSILFLTNSAKSHALDILSAPGWAQVADAIRAYGSLDRLHTSTVVHASAVVCAYRDVIAAYHAGDPERLNRISDDCGAQGASDESMSRLLGQWDDGVTPTDLTMAMLMDALSSNPALEAVESVTGAADWLGSKELQDLSQWIRTSDRDQPVPSGMPEPLMSILLAPARKSPGSLADQVAWIETEWVEWLSDSFFTLVGLAQGIAAEETAAHFGGHGPTQPPGFDTAVGFDGAGRFGHPGTPGFVDGSSRFSEDREWMPGVVMMAKQTYVWLDQLSSQYQRHIHRLDQIPDEELDSLAARGFNGLWLIGLWERSDASREIKVRRGNPEAAPSAYSLRDYAIAERLGGVDALNALRERAAQRGVRLAADMVPNHMGMDSSWVVDHPDRFLQLPNPPYPSYRFDGPNVSGDDRIEVYLEDGYWDQTDAAVVFKCVHRGTQQVRYIYHGNDGTQMPWNDTAQLDYLQPQVREAVIQTILDVARQFPIIRFDAAMTLARKHISRLWYPPPGGGGAIPSRSENTVPTEVLDRLLPGEFWREVVERVREEVPDTLLLAEAFWMMEGYFVRTLGMHRVYNSAFMHMLRDEDNAGYRGGIKSVLEYSPAILERYVNFMNNPDEDTAVDQFGKGDKYFGIATLMATLPGLPMFGHGQVEGYAEKYGMEFTRAYLDETPDQGLIDYHERVVFPILRERHKFCGVEHFALLDFARDSVVDENVFAFANRSTSTGEPSLVIYNNAFDSTAGWIKTSTAINEGEHDAPRLRQRSLGESLGVENDPNAIYGLWELRRRSWLLRSGADLHEDGFFAELNGYDALVFLDIRRLPDSDGRLRAFAESARGWLSDWESEFNQTTRTHQTELDLAQDIDDEELDCLESSVVISETEGVEE